MKSTVIDADGNVCCPNCGAKNNFTSKRSGKAKVLGVAAVGIGAVAMPKRLQCQGCGAYLKTGGVAVRSPASARATPSLVKSVPGTYAVELQDPGRKKVAVIKALKDLERLGLREAMERVDRADAGPTVLAYLEEQQARTFVDRLRQLGASARVVLPELAATPLGAAAEPASDIPAQIAKLGDLHAAGVLTDDEFHTKKTELLSRM